MLPTFRQADLAKNLSTINMEGKGKGHINFFYFTDIKNGCDDWGTIYSASFFSDRLKIELL